MPNAFADKPSQNRFAPPRSLRTNSASSAKLVVAQVNTNAKLHNSVRPGAAPFCSAPSSSRNTAIKKKNASGAVLAHSSQRRANLPSPLSSPRSVPSAPSPAPATKYSRYSGTRAVCTKNGPNALQCSGSTIVAVGRYSNALASSKARNARAGRSPLPNNARPTAAPQFGVSALSPAASAPNRNSTHRNHAGPAGHTPSAS